ncbi:pentatricopeptide repeat-containing protein At3g26630, chloroplastic [Actinidia eriantha]|uniref:pentatricopeptide repeat-containing protein At3g26630, chloroplastic n=1 Tax=Actinidia eriantha TaxID=165200 RepID=UPI002584DA98|nr:pentatricopeptide repeat-containing protein At3g26630, chloroplastic [Actinidia eriantha]
MVACLSCASPDVVFRRNKQLRFGYGDALTLLQNCADFKQLKQIHARIIRNGLSHHPLLFTKVLRLCSSYAKMDYATLVFHNQLLTTHPPTMAWNLMIRFHTLNDSSRQAIILYNHMICRGVAPDKFTFPFVVKACLASSSPDKGKEVHTLAIKSGFSHDIFLHNTLMDLYFKCGESLYARKVFDKMRARNIVSWTTMTTGLVACGELDAARALFEQIPVKNVVSWTTMISGYARNRRPYEAFELFWRMQLDNVMPNEFTLVSLLVACAELGSLRLGRWIHDFALKNGFEFGVFLGTALIDMYSKCGSLEDANQVFDSMQVKSTATWNSMITSLGVHGRGEEALDLFAKMEMANTHPDAITFVGVLCACVRTNNVAEGQRYFKYMSECYGITPNAEHYACLIELCSLHDNILDEVSN